MPTWQGMEFLERSLASLARQELELPWDFLAIDSGSSDGTWELLKQTQSSFPVPFECRQIDPVEFDHGDTRNLLVALSEGDLVVLLTQDAIPEKPDFLSLLVKNFEDEAVGAAYARNLPRPDADVLTAIFSAGDPGYAAERREVSLPSAAEYAAMDPHERRLLYNFNDVASAVRRELWERHPYPRTQFGEDILMARALLEAGFTVVYDVEATVEHSHDYDAGELLSRTAIDARFNAEWLGRICVASAADAKTLTERVSAEDQIAIGKLGLPQAEQQALVAQARELREAIFEGLYQGGLSEVRFPSSALLEEPKLSLLYVVHGFPPDTWAGTEIYTLNLALEMQRRGHRCTVLTRVPAKDDTVPDFSIEEGEFEGLRVLRMTHRLQHASLRESYQHSKAERVFRKVLRAERFDLVHFQHLIHTSAGLVDVAREEGLPTIIHLHDYWALCARVQLIRPDGVICHENQGLGCHLCVKETATSAIAAASRLTSNCGPVLRQWATDAAEAQSSLAPRLGSLRDLIDRQPFVLAAYAAADLRISPSRFLRGKLLESGAFDPRTTLFSDNGMRTDHVRSLKKEPDAEGRVRFGFVGSLVWYKGGETMVRAMRELIGEKAVLNVYGDFKPDEEEHHRELQELARGADVHFKGRFDNARLSEVYAEIDVLIVPSIWYENSPITIHEAYLTNTPILASDIGGMAEYVRDEVDGLHFKVGDEADLARKMQRFVDEPDLVQALSKDFMEIKTIEDNACEMEFRYRSLVSRVRTKLPRQTTDEYAFEATDYAQVEGAAIQQGADMLLLGPAPSAAEYGLSECGQGRHEVALDLFLLGGEPDVSMQGRVLFGDVEVALIPASCSAGEDEVRTIEFELELTGGESTLRIENVGQGSYLRLKRIMITSVEGMSDV